MTIRLVATMVAALYLAESPPPPPSSEGVPIVVGLPESLAETVITSYGFTVGTVTYEYSDTMPAGSVIRQDPRGSVSAVPLLDDYALLALGVFMIAIACFACYRLSSWKAKSSGT
jgi:hypothetical protein